MTDKKFEKIAGIIMIIFFSSLIGAITVKIFFPIDAFVIERTPNLAEIEIIFRVSFWSTLIAASFILTIIGIGTALILIWKNIMTSEKSED